MTKIRLSKGYEFEKDLLTFRQPIDQEGLFSSPYPAVPQEGGAFDWAFRCLRSLRVISNYYLFQKLRTYRLLKKIQQEDFLLWERTILSSATAQRQSMSYLGESESSQMESDRTDLRPEKKMGKEKRRLPFETLMDI